MCILLQSWCYILALWFSTPPYKHQTLSKALFTSVEASARSLYCTVCTGYSATFPIKPTDPIIRQWGPSYNRSDINRSHNTCEYSLTHADRCIIALHNLHLLIPYRGFCFKRQTSPLDYVNKFFYGGGDSVCFIMFRVSSVGILFFNYLNEYRSRAVGNNRAYVVSLDDICPMAQPRHPLGNFFFFFLKYPEGGPEHNMNTALYCTQSADGCALSPYN